VTKKSKEKSCDHEWQKFAAKVHIKDMAGTAHGRKCKLCGLEDIERYDFTETVEFQITDG
jgi:hypothetical protein